MRQIFNKYIVIVLCTLAFWIGGVPLLFMRAVPIICENLSYNSNYEFKVERPRLYTSIIPNAYIKTHSITILSKQSSDKIYIENPKLNLRLLPLLSGRIHINTIKADNLTINTVLNNNSRPDKNTIAKFLNTKLYCNNIQLSQIAIDIKQPNKQSPIQYIGKDITYKNNSRYLKFNLDSILKIEDNKSSAKVNLYLPKNNNVNKSNIDIHCANFNIAPLADYFRDYIPSDIKHLQGIVDIDADKEHLNAEFTDLAILNKDEAKSIICPKKLNIKSGLNITRKTLYFSNAEIKSKNIDTVVNGSISNYIDKSLAESNLEIRINKSRIEDFISMLPAFKTEDIDAYKLKKYKFYGDILGNFTIKGNCKEPLINGNIFIDKGILTKPIPNANGASVKLAFKGKYLNYDVQVPAGGTEKVFVLGNVELYNVKYADMRVWSTQNIDLAVAEEKVNPIHEILNFIIGPVPIMDVKGVGNIDITVKGNRKIPHVWGSLNFRNVTTYFNDIPDLVLTNADATLTFDDEKAAFNLQKGLVNGKNINIDGSCTLAGKFDFDVKTYGQHLSDLYKAIQTSTMINEIKNMIPQIDAISGLSNLTLKVYGNIKDIEYVKFNENFFTKGVLTLLNNKIEVQGVKITDTSGNIAFENTNADINLTSSIGNAKFSVKAFIKDKIADANISAPKLNLKDLSNTSDKIHQEIANIIIDLNAKYKGRTDKIEYDKLDLYAQVLGSAKNNKLKLSNGIIILKNNKLQIKNLIGNFVDTDSSFNINLKADSSSAKPMINGNIQLKNFELNLINFFGEYSLLPQNIRDIINQVHFEKGKINLNAVITNNNVNASTNIGGIGFTYSPLNLPVNIVNGSIYMRKNNLGLNKINLMAEDMPILLDGSINNIFSKPVFDLYINSKPKQEFINKYFNNNKIYPLKIKGDIVYWLKLKGVKDNFDLTAEANISKDSSIYYLGATVGDIENAIILNINTNVLKQHILKIKEFSYDKLITSQGKRQTRLNMLKADGIVDILKDDFAFNDLKVKTSNPTDARIFNIMFRKPNIKQGQFTSDLRFNGKLSNPKILGTFHIVETNIPFFDTTMKNISFIFKDKTIELSSTGEVLGNAIKFKGTLRNKLSVPYYIENAELYTKIIDLNYLIEKLKSAQMNEINALDSFATLDIKDIIVKKIYLNANEIRLRNLTALNVSADASVSDKKEFKINNFKFDIADGSLNGDFAYSFLNNNMDLKLNAKDINANDLSIALFNLKNQIYGDLTGKININCNGADFNRCMETLNGNSTFNVTDGRMPKLGSLEYLLKAGNLIKGGITSVSINSVTDILTPLKTGNFSDIYGVLNIKDGIADDIEITTKGKDLSLFMSGTYNFATSVADMEVLGLLSKKISTMFGPIGNVSINTLFNVIPGVDLSKDSVILDKINKIPGIELSGKSFRKFIAEIKGDINSDNYVSTFKWIN